MATAHAITNLDLTIIAWAFLRSTTHVPGLKVKTILQKCM